MGPFHHGETGTWAQATIGEGAELDGVGGLPTGRVSGSGSRIAHPDPDFGLPLRRDPGERRGPSYGAAEP